jgi:hypothetical protein
VTHLRDGADNITVKLGSSASLNVLPNPLPFRSPVSYTDPQILRYEEDAETADDYGRSSRDDDAFEDDATEGSTE